LDLLTMPITADDLEQEFQEEQAKRARAKTSAESKFDDSSWVPRQCRWLLGAGVLCALLILVLPQPARLPTEASAAESRRAIARDPVEPEGGHRNLPVTSTVKLLKKTKTTIAPFKSAGDIGRRNGEAAFKWLALPGSSNKNALQNTVQTWMSKRPFFPDCCPMAVKTIQRATRNIRTMHWEMKGYLWGDQHPQYKSFLLVAHAIADYIPPDGLIMEFGVASGGSIVLTAGILKAKQDQRTAYGFDTFTGLPEDWGGFKKGAFAYDKSGKLPPVPKGVVLIKGLFDVSLPKFLKAHTEPAAFINIDCDLYAGAIAVLRLLEPRMRPGTILHFHELNQPDFADELKALADFLHDHPNIKLELLNVYAHGEAALMRVVSVGNLTKSDA
jgi:hypothetical protein